MDLSGFRAVLQTLANHRVEFIVVGGVAAVLTGAPVNTFDLDVVHSREPENLQRLVAALGELDACYRHRPEFRPNESIGANTYPDLLPHTELVEISADLRVRVLDLETQVAIKEECGREKDLAVLPILRRTLAESRRLKQA